MITTGILSHVRYLLEEKGVRLLFLSLLWSEDPSMRWSVFFYLTVATETENLNIWSKLNQWAKIP